MTLNVTVKNRIATYVSGQGIPVCGNTGDQVKFTFDEEWSQHETKTARFKWGGKVFDQEFTGNICEIPNIDNTDFITVGVFVGEEKNGEDELSTTDTTIPYRRSTRCGNNIPHGESGANYTNEAKGYATEAKASADAAKANADAARALADEFERDFDGIKRHVQESENTIAKLQYECERSVNADGKLHCILERDGFEDGSIYGITEMVMSGYINWNDGSARSSYFNLDITRQCQGVGQSQSKTMVFNGVVCAKKPDGTPSEPRIFCIKAVVQKPDSANGIEGIKHGNVGWYNDVFAMAIYDVWVYDHEAGWKEASVSSVKVRTIMPRILEQK